MWLTGMKKPEPKAHKKEIEEMLQVCGLDKDAPLAVTPAAVSSVPMNFQLQVRCSEDSFHGMQRPRPCAVFAISLLWLCLLLYLRRLMLAAG